MNREARRKNYKKHKKLVLDHKQAIQFLYKQDIIKFIQTTDKGDTIIPIEEAPVSELREYLFHNYGIKMTQQTVKVTL